MADDQHDMFGTTKRQAAAMTLITLLIEHVEHCDLWEAHYLRCANKQFASLKEETAEHTRLQSTYTLPLMEKCYAEGFQYIVIMNIIKGAFNTRSEQRKVAIENVIDWVETEYGLTVE